MPGMLDALQHLDEIGIRFPHVLRQLSLFLVCKRGETGSDAAQGGGNVVDVIKHANELACRRHECVLLCPRAPWGLAIVVWRWNFCLQVARSPAQALPSAAADATA